jgi:predicted deacylase
MSSDLDLTKPQEKGRRSYDLDIVGLGDGSTLKVPVSVLVGAAPGPCLVLVAGIHGDEGEGILALTELWDELDVAAIAGRVVIVPVANPPAFAAWRRCSPLDDLDLNRIFPGNPDGRPSERLAHRLFHDVLCRADFVFSMHSWYTTGTVLPYVEFNHRGSTARASLDAATASGFELIRISNWSAGLMTAVVNAAGIAGMEAEIGGAGISLAENRARYKNHVQALMTHLRMVPDAGQPDNAGRQNPRRRVVDHVDLFAPAGGILRLNTGLGEEVSAGETLAVIQGFHHETIGKVLSPAAGLIGAVRAAASVQPGDHVFRLFRDVDLDRLVLGAGTVTP